MRFKPTRAERGDRLVRQPQRSERQRRKRVALRAVRDDRRRRAEARGGPGRADGRRRRRRAPRSRSRVTPRQQVVAQIAASPPNRCAQPPMSRQDAVGRIERDQRRVALAPVGDGVEQARVGRLRPPARRQAQDAWRAPAPARGPGAARGAPPRRRSRPAGRDCRACRTRRGEGPSRPHGFGRCRRLTPLLPDAVGREPVEPEAQDALRG